MAADYPVGYLDERDRAHAETLEGEEREIVVSTVARFRRRDRLEVGDRLPALDVVRLSDGERMPLRSLGGDGPLVLVFGSFT